MRSPGVFAGVLTPCRLHGLTSIRLTRRPGDKHPEHGFRRVRAQRGFCDPRFEVRLKRRISPHVRSGKWPACVSCRMFAVNGRTRALPHRASRCRAYISAHDLCPQHHQPVSATPSSPPPPLRPHALSATTPPPPPVSPHSAPRTIPPPQRPPVQLHPVAHQPVWPLCRPVQRPLDRAPSQIPSALRARELHRHGRNSLENHETPTAPAQEARNEYGGCCRRPQARERSLNLAIRNA